MQRNDLDSQRPALADKSLPGKGCKLTFGFFVRLHLVELEERQVKKYSCALGGFCLVVSGHVLSVQPSSLPLLFKDISLQLANSH